MWNRINANTVHLLYLSISSFLCLFMLFSAVIKDKLYFGEANVALLVGAILGPFAANAVDPNIWSHFDTVVLEFSRVVIIIQCFAVALELPKRYIHSHWKSLFWLVGPVVVWGWMVCTLLVWFMVPRLSFTQSMTIASCFNAIDPVMAATIVGNGRFARRIPAHLRNLLLAESASNDVTTSVCLGLSILLTRFPGTASELARSLFVYTILYQIFLAVGIGLTIGWAAGKALEYQEKNDSTDRESFLVFYLMVALVCIGLGSLLGIDDVLMAFCAGYNFDKTGWWRRKTEESHVSDAINLLLNLTYFVFLGSMIPWSSFNKPDLHISAWRLVAGTVLIFVLRRLPVIMLLKGVIPDIKTWREALFFGHFGPVGVGAIFSAALISSEPGKTGIAGNLLKPTPGDPMQISLWPVVTFVVLCSSIVHGSSIPLFKFAKQFNTLTITMSYTAGNEDGPGWINRLPRITTPSSSQGRTPPDTGEYPPGSLPTVGIPGALLRRQRGEDSDSNTSHTSSVIPRRRRRRKWDSGIGTGGSVSESAIYPSRAFRNQESEKRGPAMAYRFGNIIIVEDEDGEVIKTYDLPGSASAATSNSARQTHKELSWKGFGVTNGSEKDDDNDKRIRFTIDGTGRRMTKHDFLREIQALDPKARAEPLDPQAESSKQAERRPEIQTSGLPEMTGPQEENNPLASARYYPETAIEKRRRLAALGVSAHSDTSDNDSQAPDRTGPWESGGLISPSETKEEGGLDISANDASADAISGRSDAGQIDASNSSELSSKQSVPVVIITGTEGQTQSTWPNEGGEEAESDVSEPGKKPKDKGKKKVSFEL